MERLKNMSLRRAFFLLTACGLLAAVALATLLLLCTSLLQRKMPIRTWFNRFPLPVRAMTLAALLLMAVYFGVPASGNVGGFLYEQF